MKTCRTENLGEGGWPLSAAVTHKLLYLQSASDDSKAKQLICVLR
jgi:hypothetical protein